MIGGQWWNQLFCLQHLCKKCDVKVLEEKFQFQTTLRLNLGTLDLDNHYILYGLWGSDFGTKHIFQLLEFLLSKLHRKTMYVYVNEYVQHFDWPLLFCYCS